MYVMYGAEAYSGCERLVESERDIIERWCKGDKRAFEVLVRRHMHDAFLIALGFTGNAEDARDLSQDAFIKAYQARKRFDPAKPFYPWFYRILKNHCLNFVQRVRKKTESLYYDDRQERERFSANLPSALEQMETTERNELLRAAIERLSFEHREVIILKNFRGLSYREMAETLDTPIGTIMSRLYYARKALREILLRWEKDGANADMRHPFKEKQAPGEVV